MQIARNVQKVGVVGGWRNAVLISQHAARTKGPGVGVASEGCKTGFLLSERTDAQNRRRGNRGWGGVLFYHSHNSRCKWRLQLSFCYNKSTFWKRTHNTHCTA